MRGGEVGVEGAPDRLRPTNKIWLEAGLRVRVSADLFAWLCDAVHLRPLACCEIPRKGYECT